MFVEERLGLFVLGRGRHVWLVAHLAHEGVEVVERGDQPARRVGDHHARLFEHLLGFASVMVVLGGVRLEPGDPRLRRSTHTTRETTVLAVCMRRFFHSPRRGGEKNADRAPSRGKETLKETRPRDTGRARRSPRSPFCSARAARKHNFCTLPEVFRHQT